MTTTDYDDDDGTMTVEGDQRGSSSASVYPSSSVLMDNSDEGDGGADYDAADGALAGNVILTPLPATTWGGTALPTCRQCLSDLILDSDVMRCGTCGLPAVAEEPQQQQPQPVEPVAKKAEPQQQQQPTQTAAATTTDPARRKPSGKGKK